MHPYCTIYSVGITAHYQAGPKPCISEIFPIFFFSPFEVVVGPEAGAQKIRAWGPGLEGGVVGRSADFVAESIGPDVGVLGEFCLVQCCLVLTEVS